MSGCAETLGSAPVTGRDAAAGDAGVTLTDGGDAGSETPRDVPVLTPSDAGPQPDAGVGPLSHECARGVWCFERPTPTGDELAQAVAVGADGAALVTTAGVLSVYREGRWQTRVLSLPGRPTALHVDADGSLVLAAVDRQNERRAWLAVGSLDAPTFSLYALPEGDSVSQFQRAGSTLWALATRGLYRLRGGQWERLGNLPSMPVLSGFWAEGDDRAVVLESWGSGSGAGVLHRWQDGAWRTVFDFRGNDFRVEGPVVLRDGAIYLRAWYTRLSRAGLVRVVGDRFDEIDYPTQGGYDRIHAVGDALWLTSGGRAWRLDRDAFVPVDAYPAGDFAQLVGTPGAAPWVFGRGVYRYRNNAWQTLSEGEVAAGRFWFDGPRPRLASYRPIGFLESDSETPARWSLRPAMSAQVAYEDVPAVGGVGYVLTEAGFFAVQGGQWQNMAAWPPSVRRPSVAGGSSAGLWVWSDGVLVHGWRAGAWERFEAPPFPDAPRGDFRVVALHYTTDGALFAAASVLTGDKQVRNRVFLREGDNWRQLVAEQGEFGRSPEAHFYGATRDAVWFSLDGLYRFDGQQAREVAPGLLPHGLGAATAGGVAVVNDRTVRVYERQGRELFSLALPPVRALFQSAWYAPEGDELRIANRQGWVLRLRR